MRVARHSLGLLAFGLVLALVTHCSPQELAYEPSGVFPDGSAGTGAVAGDSGTGGTGVGGATGWPEVCGNGIDDDLNGKTDCEDAECESYACVDLAPSGWTGPVALYEGATGAVADCPEGLTAVHDGYAGVDFAPATCSCTCGSPNNLGCTVAVSYYSTAACLGLLGSGSVGVGAGCGATTASTPGSLNVAFTPSGSCGAGTPSAPVKSAPSWKLQSRACALAQGSAKPAGCAAGKVCAPLSSEALACIFREGDLDCPTGYPSRRTYYADFDDSRSCGSCSCGFAADACSATVSAYQESSCATLAFSAGSAGCYQGTAHAVAASNQKMTNARCESAGAPSNGCVAPAKPTTVCCAGGDEPCPSGKGPRMVRVSAVGGGNYCVDSTEVTRAQYQEFLASNPAITGQSSVCSWNSSYTPTLGWPPTTANADRPVDWVDWCDATAFCAWAGKRLCGKIGGGSADTAGLEDAGHSQWYNACSGGGVHKYPYGDDAISDACALGSLFSSLELVKSHPCCEGGFPGIYDLVGNAEEWEDSCEAKGSDPSNDKCAVRGDTTCDNPSQQNRKDRQLRLGFRCCS